jgi:hypothetical protein
LIQSKLHEQKPDFVQPGRSGQKELRTDSKVQTKKQTEGEPDFVQGGKRCLLELRTGSKKRTELDLDDPNQIVGIQMLIEVLETDLFRSVGLKSSQIVKLESFQHSFEYLKLI